MVKNVSTKPATDDSKLTLTTEQAKELIRRIELWKEQLFDDPKVSPTKFGHFQTALYGAKCIIQDMGGIPRAREHAWVK